MSVPLDSFSSTFLSFFCLFHVGCEVEALLLVLRYKSTMLTFLPYVHSLLSLVHIIPEDCTYVRQFELIKAALRVSPPNSLSLENSVCLHFIHLPTWITEEGLCLVEKNDITFVFYAYFLHTFLKIKKLFNK